MVIYSSSASSLTVRMLLRPGWFPKLIAAAAEDDRQRDDDPARLSKLPVALKLSKLPTLLAAAADLANRAPEP
jgi:hypothetical protein